MMLEALTRYARASIINRSFGYLFPATFLSNLEISDSVVGMLRIVSRNPLEVN